MFLYSNLLLSKDENDNLYRHDAQEHSEWIYIGISYARSVCAGLFSYIGKGGRIGIGTCQNAEQCEVIDMEEVSADDTA